MIRILNLFKKYKNKSSDFSLEINNLVLPNQGLVFVLGKSGSGKSTLLNMLGLLDDADKGEILFDNIGISKMSRREKDDFRNFNIGFVFQNINLISGMTVIENLKIVQQLQNSKTNIESIADSLNKVGLSGYENRKLSTLSGGEKQRVAIARALIKNSKILLCDEPTGSLDSKNGKKVFELLREVAKEKLVVVISHDESFAKEYSDRIIRIADGRIVSDSVSSFSSEPGNCFTQNSAQQNKKLQRTLFNQSLKMKPSKIIISGLAFILSLTTLSLTVTSLNYDGDTAMREMMVNSGENIITLSKNNVYQTGTVGGFNFIDSDIDYLETLLDEDVLSIRGSNLLNNNFDKPHVFNGQKRSPYYPKKLSGYVSTNENELDTFKYSLVEGAFPVSNNEIAITEFTYKLFNIFGFNNNNIVLDEPTMSDLIGREIFLDDRDNICAYTITGIIDTKMNYEHIGKPYIDLKANGNKELLSSIEGSIHLSVFINDNQTIEGLDLSLCDKVVVNYKDAKELNNKLGVIGKAKNPSGKDSGDDTRGYMYSTYSLETFEFYKIKSVINTMNLIACFLGVGSGITFAIAAVFAALFFNDFVHSQKKRNATLKSLGARNSLLSTVIILQSVFYIGIFFVSSLLVSVVAHLVMNKQIFNILNTYKLMNFDFKNIIIILLTLFVGLAIGLTRPLITSSRLKPIDLLRE